MKQYQASIYPGNVANPTITHADPKRKNIAVCFSGGGSRALTCAWGQLLGLSALKDEKANPLLNDVRYISSVSGGSWAAVLYTFRPHNFTDAEFLGNSYDPSQLHYDQNKAGGLNVNVMGPSALGKIPQNFANLFELEPTKNIIADFIVLTALKGIPLRTSAKWLWCYIVGENVLADFDLYTYKNSIFKPRETPWQYPDAKYFSLSKDYAAKNIFSKPGAPPEDAFVYARTNSDGQPACPMLIINTNIIAKDRPGTSLAAPLQIPTQVSAVAAGIYGASPYAPDKIGGGGVDSFAFTSSLSSLSGIDKVNADFPMAYTLADITACSSAFFAAILADPLEAAVAALLERNDEHLHLHFSKFVEKADSLIMSDMRRKLSEIKDDLQKMDKGGLVPQYNYWPVNQVSHGAAANQNTQFTDGGSLENTGVAGLLAQAQGTVGNIIAFVNGAEVLEKRNDVIIAATQMAPLFGIAYDDVHQQFKKYLPNGINPFTGQTDPLGFLQVFENGHSEFDALRQGLYAGNGAGAKTDAAFCLQTLQVVKNPLLGITQTRPVNVLWVQNAQVNNWQKQVTDPALQQKITNGQQKGGTSEFAGFPYYSTFKKIHQTPAETNTLAQMWSWCVGNKASPLSAAIAKMFASS
jgi:hypothetical protein